MLDELKPSPTGDSVQIIRNKLLAVARKLAEQRHHDQDVFGLAADLMARRPAVNAVHLAVSIATLGELLPVGSEPTLACPRCCSTPTSAAPGT